MDTATLQSLISNGIFEVLKIIAAPLGAALAVGLVIAIFQATTSIQEQTLTFLPKLATILIVIALLSGWMFTDLSGYTKGLFESISELYETDTEITE